LDDTAKEKTTIAKIESSKDEEFSSDADL